MISQKEFDILSKSQQEYEIIKSISTYALIDELRNRVGVNTTFVSMGEMTTTKLCGPRILLVVSVDQGPF